MYDDCPYSLSEKFENSAEKILSKNYKGIRVSTLCQIGLFIPKNLSEKLFCFARKWSNPIQKLQGDEKTIQAKSLVKTFSGLFQKKLLLLTKLPKHESRVMGAKSSCLGQKFSQEIFGKNPALIRKSNLSTQVSKQAKWTTNVSVNK